MRMRLILQLMLLVMLLVGSSEEFFFEYPKNALMNVFQSLKTKVQPPKTNIEHYHVHYYPFPVLTWRAPDKRDLEHLYENTLRFFGWSDYYYKYSPDPSIIVSSGLQHLWDNTDPWNEEILHTDDVDTIDRNYKGILVQVPANKNFVFQLLKRSRKNAT